MAQPAESAAGEPTHHHEPEISDAVLTVPNIITFMRLGLIPVFLWLIFTERDLAAGTLLALIAATDFVDGKVARHYGQVSRLGTMLDPAADRILILAAAIAVIVRGDIMPLWLIGILVLRELITAAWVLWIKANGIQIVVRFIGKVQASLVFASIPCFIWASGFNNPASGNPSDAFLTAGDVFTVAGYVFGLSGAVLGYATFGLYVNDGLRALRIRRTTESETIGEIS